MEGGGGKEGEKAEKARGGGWDCDRIASRFPPHSFLRNLREI